MAGAAARARRQEAAGMAVQGCRDGWPSVGDRVPTAGATSPDEQPACWVVAAAG